MRYLQLGLLLVGAAAAVGTAPAGGAADRAAAPGRVLFTDLVSGPVRGGPDGLGVPLTVYGAGLGGRTEAATVTIGGKPVARVLSWEERAAGGGRLDRIVVQPGPGVQGGRVEVRRGARVLRGSATFTATTGRILLVAPGGDDGAPCTLGRPCATIQHAVDAVLRAGDVLLVKGPHIADDEIWIRRAAGGRPGLPKAIVAYPGESPAFARVSRPLIVDGSHVVVAGLVFPGGKSVVAGADLPAATTRDVRVVGNLFRGTLGYDAVGTHGVDIVVAGNDCTVDGSTVGTQGHCFYVSAGRGVRLLYNVGRGAPGYGIHVFDQRRSAGEGRRVISDVLIEGNLLAASSERSGLILAMGDEESRGNHISGVVIRDNVFAANNHAGIVIGDRVSGVRIERNTFWANGRQGLHVSDLRSISGVLVRGNLFVQPAAGPCRSGCSWFRPAQVEAGVSARGVRVTGNWYAPRRLLIGAADRAGRSGAVRLAGEATLTGRADSPAAARRFGARFP